MASTPGTTAAPPVLASRDIVAGLGAAPRDLLAACLALFDDSTLQRRIGTLIDRWTSKKDGNTGPTDAEAAAAVQGSLRAWKESPLSDDALCVLLWMYLREAFAVPPLTFASQRSAGTASSSQKASVLDDLPLFAHQPAPAPKSKDPIHEALDAVRPDDMTPKQAIEALYELKKLRDDARRR